MIRVAMAATRTAAMATAISATVSTTIAPSVTATTSVTASTATATATATAIFRIGGAHDGQVNGKQWRGCKHQGAGKDRKETFIL